MALPYPKEQLLKVYKTLPEGLKEALGSVETQDQITEICEQNGVTDPATIDLVYNLVMDIFMGMTTSETFAQELGKILKEDKTTDEIAHRIQRFVIFPLKAELIQLYKFERSSMVQTQPQQETEPSSAEAMEGEEEDGYIEPAESTSRIQAGPPPATTSTDVGGGGEPKRGPDQYREPIE